MEWPTELYQSTQDRFARGGDGVIREVGIYENLLPAFQRGEMRVDPSDVFVISYPKSGTVWISNIVAGIVSHGDSLAFTTETNFLDVTFGLSTEEKLAKLNAFKGKNRRLFLSHIWPELLPPKVFEQNCKIIYVMRNPKDVAVSYYHFHRASKFVGQGAKDWTFSHFLSHFLNNLAFGNWFDHVSKWWNYKEHENICYLKYEDILKDRHKYVCHLADFLDIKLTKDEAKAVTDATGFGVMKNYIIHNTYTILRNWSKTVEGEPATETNELEMDDNVENFVRKGKVGDWKNHFTVAESEKFDKVYKEKMCHLQELQFNYE